MKIISRQQLDRACRAAIFAYNEGEWGTAHMAVSVVPVLKAGHVEGLEVIVRAQDTLLFVTIPSGKKSRAAWDAFFEEVSYGALLVETSGDVPDPREFQTEAAYKYEVARQQERRAWLNRAEPAVRVALISVRVALICLALFCVAFLLAYCTGCAATPAVIAHRDPIEMRVAFTGSMRPVLRGGERVLVVPCRMAEVQVGDVIDYYDARREMHICHRVIGRTVTLWGAPALLVKGDHNAERDRVLVTAENLTGKITVLAGN